VSGSGSESAWIRVLGDPDPDLKLLALGLDPGPAPGSVPPLSASKSRNIKLRTFLPSLAHGGIWIRGPSADPDPDPRFLILTWGSGTGSEIVTVGLGPVHG